MTDSYKERITLAITGASGAQYGLRLLECLVAARCQVLVMISKAAQVVIATETDEALPGLADEQEPWLTQRVAAAGGQIM